MSIPLKHLFEHHHFIVDAQQVPTRIDLFLVGRIASLTRAHLQKGMLQGCVRVNGSVVKPSYKVKPHDSIKVLLPQPRQNHTLVAEKIALDIVYEDAYLLVINKPARMVVHPGIGNWSGTLVNGLVYYLNALPCSAGNEMRPGLLHRLDKGTSGLILVAKKQEVLHHINAQFARHTIARTYHALVWGDVKDDQGTVSAAMRRCPNDRKKMAIAEESAQGKHATTHYKVLERFGYVTLIECQLETGRTHQIRVHMQYLGHPLFGDPVYGGDRVVKGQCFSKYKMFIQNCFALLPYQALHAKTLGFYHPVEAQHRVFESPLPEPFLAVLEKWRRYVQHVLV